MPARDLDNEAVDVGQAARVLRHQLRRVALPALAHAHQDAHRRRRLLETPSELIDDAPLKGAAAGNELEGNDVVLGGRRPATVHAPIARNRARGLGRRDEPRAVAYGAAHLRRRHARLLQDEARDDAKGRGGAHARGHRILHPLLEYEVGRVEESLVVVRGHAEIVRLEEQGARAEALDHAHIALKVLGVRVRERIGLPYRGRAQCNVTASQRGSRGVLLSHCSPGSSPE